MRCRPSPVLQIAIMKRCLRKAQYDLASLRHDLQLATTTSKVNSAHCILKRKPLGSHTMLPITMFEFASSQFHHRVGWMLLELLIIISCNHTNFFFLCSTFTMRPFIFWVVTQPPSICKSSWHLMHFFGSYQGGTAPMSWQNLATMCTMTVKCDTV